MQAFDQLNTRYGRGTIKLGCALTGKKTIDTETALSWELRRIRKSACTYSKP